MKFVSIVGLTCASLALAACSSEPSVVAAVEPTGTASSALLTGPCDAPPPDEAVKPVHGIVERMKGNRKAWAEHHGYDLLVNPGDEQWAIGSFGYGTAPMMHEPNPGLQVDVLVLRDCGDTWTHLGSGTTSTDETAQKHREINGVKDEAGKFFFKIPRSQQLGVGRHRVRLVAPTDNTATELFIYVLEPGTRLAVTDIDGTLTSSENAAGLDIASAHNWAPDAHEDAATVMQILAKNGYVMMYTTARPEWMMSRTRWWLNEQQFPPGLVNLSRSALGAIGLFAKKHKIEIFKEVAAKGITPSFGFGNRQSDLDAYQFARIPSKGLFFFDFEDNLKKTGILADLSAAGRNIKSYTDIVAVIERSAAE